MIVQEMGPSPGRVFTLVFETDDEVIEGLEAFAEERQLDAAHFTAIGAFRRATIAWYDLERKEYRENPIDEQVEVVSLVGNVTLAPDGGRKVHAHVALGHRNGTGLAGHLLRGTVRPTLEVFLTETPGTLRREHDPTTGLALIR